MKTSLLLSTITTLLLVACSGARADNPISVKSELERMRSADHLFRPQTHRIVQYSGFHRKGGNPDRMHCLYLEKGWRVIADHKGPGVVTRIWTTHDTQWRDIQIEVDGKIIFTGKANQFFKQDKLPFVAPLSEIRSVTQKKVTAEKESQGKKQWAVSYVPIPFKKHFRYMQRDKIYANINVKVLPAGQAVESFLDADWDALRPEFDKTADVWRSMNLYGPKPEEKFKRIAKSISIPAAPKGKSTTAELAELTGPAVLRGIRVRAKTPSQLRPIDLQIRWDGEKEPSVNSPLDHGFGSREHRTLALGQSPDGWRFCLLPMPFRKKATLTLVSRAAKPVECDVELFVEENAALPDDVLYLHSHQNRGRYAKGRPFDKPDLPLADFFYHNGYTAFDRQGAGHLVAYMDLFNCQPELDEHIYFDDERTFPNNSWNGTGHEDLFDMAWGHSPVSAPMTSGGSENYRETNVKLFWNNPMTFRTAIRFNWELAFRHGILPPRNACFASVVYWYERP
ncbi:MAG: DUF2961 domain-containing protein [Pirellulales bacterium]|nr:DUF2961 domain-containing protein [Pirellulales bacterium]